MTDEPTSHEPIGPQRPADDVRGDGDDDTDTATTDTATTEELRTDPPATTELPLEEDPDDDLWADPIEAAWGDVLHPDPDPAASGFGSAFDDGFDGLDDGFDGGTTLPPPPPTGPPTGQGSDRTTQGLVRDPYTRLGGVASGVAHYYGIDTSIVRILFLALALSTGFGFGLYFLAWLIIPRAQHWPPTSAPRSLGSLSGRDLGVVLAIGGLVVALAVGSSGGGFLGSVLLIGGGIWLLSQPSREAQVAGVPSGAAPTAPAGSWNPPTPGQPADAWEDTPGADWAAHRAGTSGHRESAGSGDSWNPPPNAYVAVPRSNPVGPRRRRWWIPIGIVLAGMLLLAAIMVGLGLVAWAVATDGSIDIDRGPNVHRTLDSVDDFPLVYDADGGGLVIDLTELSATDLDDLAELDDPATIDADVDFGEIRVIVPDDLAVSVDAEAGVGEVTVLGEHDDGLDANVAVDGSDALVDLQLDVGFGRVVVERG